MCKEPWKRVPSGAKNKHRIFVGEAALRVLESSGIHCDWRTVCEFRGKVRVVMRGAGRARQDLHCLSLKTMVARLFSLLSTIRSPRKG